MEITLIISGSMNYISYTIDSPSLFNIHIPLFAFILLFDELLRVNYYAITH